MKAIYVVIDSVRGSAPRDAGTAMMVTAKETRGTIGGGALEFRAIARARALLAKGSSARETVPLGPGLGQCCGGAVVLNFTYEPHSPDINQVLPLAPSTRDHTIWLWGAGHVGRAFAHIGTNQGGSVCWVDNAPDRFPRNIPAGIEQIIAKDMPRLAAQSDRKADHLIFTYSHDIDLALCASLLQRQVRSIGLIGSATKWARFSKRLRDMGLDPSPITCPIGDKTRGKHPDAIAHSTLELLLTQPRISA